MTDEPARPDPDALLAQVTAEAAAARRGKLKIFFGAAPGVGKTYTMLSAAREARAQGVDAVVGVVETHGRPETEALLDGLEVLPRRRVEYRGHTLAEFDLDAALARHPPLLLVDELAHTNAPGSRHPKRWQDVEELLGAGIDVWTTLNVQHLESLNDVVGGITGVRVWETVPDRVFDAADEVALVDLPPDDLLTRLKEGKVYLPAQAAMAAEHFFRRANLIALRDLSLRRLAERVDAQVQTARAAGPGARVWATAESLLVCVGPGDTDGKLIRSAARLASKLDARWHAVYIETPRLQRLPEDRRSAILATLRLAQELGAETAVLTAPDIVDAALDYARAHNLGRILIGRRARPQRRWWGRFMRRLGERAPDIDLIAVARSAEAPPAPRPAAARRAGRALRALRRGGGAVRGRHRGGHAAATCARTHQHRHAVPAGRGGGRLSLGARAGGAGGGAVGGAVRFLLRAATVHVRSERRAVSGHVCGDAGRRARHRPADGAAALSGAHRRPPRAAHPQPLRDGPRAGRGAQRNAGGADRRAFPRRHLPCPRAGAAGGRARQTHRAHRGDAAGRSRHRAVVFRSRRAGRPRHRHATGGRGRLFAAEGAGRHAGRARGAAGQPPPAAHPRTAPPARNPRHADRHGARAPALRHPGAPDAPGRRLRAPAQYAAGRAVARFAHAAHRAGRPRRHAHAAPARRAGAGARDRRRHPRPGAAHQPYGGQPAGNGAPAVRHRHAAPRLAGPGRDRRRRRPGARTRARRPSTADRPAGRPAAGAGRRHHAGAGAGQPARQRHQVHAARHADRHHRSGRRRCARGRRVGCGPRPAAGSGAGAVRALRARDARVGDRRRGSWPCHLPGHRHGTWRAHPGRKPPRGRGTLHLHPAARAAAGGTSGAPIIDGTALIVEDDPAIRLFVRRTLEDAGLKVAEAATLARGLIEAGTRRPDLVILDLGLPDGDGRDFITALRAWSRVPVIVLSARAQEADKVAALDAGADDYLTKPFGVAELLARVRVALRHGRSGAGGGPMVRLGAVTVDLVARRVQRGDEDIHLTAVEFRLLTALLKAPGRVLTHRHLLREVWGPNSSEHGHYLRIYMARLRHKLEADPARPRYLLTETGIGYRYAPETSDRE